MGKRAVLKIINYTSLLLVQKSCDLHYTTNNNNWLILLLLKAGWWWLDEVVYWLVKHNRGYIPMRRRRRYFFKSSSLPWYVHNILLYAHGGTVHIWTSLTSLHVRLLITIYPGEVWPLRQKTWLYNLDIDFNLLFMSL